MAKILNYIKVICVDNKLNKNRDLNKYVAEVNEEEGKYVYLTIDKVYKAFEELD